MQEGSTKRLGLIAGNGRFPFLLLEAARAQGVEVVVAAIREETDPAMNGRAETDPGVAVHWFSLGELSRLIETFQREGVRQAVMAGQVKHKQIFSSIRPDWRLAKLLLNLRSRNTDMLLGAIAKVLGDEGIELISSTAYLEPMLAPAGVLTAREPSAEERENAAYGRGVALALAGYDIGQTVVVAGRACVAVEAMEGTDAAVERAGAILKTLAGEDAQTPAAIGAVLSASADPASVDPASVDPASVDPASVDPASGDPRAINRTAILDRRLTVVKVAKPNQDARFDVPVIGPQTIQTMQQSGATCLALEAGRTLIFDRETVVQLADDAGIAIFAVGP